MQNTKDALKFYGSKVEELGKNLKDLESIVHGKSNNLRVVEDGLNVNVFAAGTTQLIEIVLRQKVITNSGDTSTLSS